MIEFFTYFTYLAVATLFFCGATLLRLVAGPEKWTVRRLAN